MLPVLTISKERRLKPPHYSWAKSPPPIYSDRAVSYKFLDKTVSHQLRCMVQSISYLLLYIFILCYLAGPAATTSGVEIVTTRKCKDLQRRKNEDVVTV